MERVKEKIRLDKWLWAARFYKTRALAAEAVNGGKVHLGGHRVKPARAVKIDDRLDILRGFDRYEVIVTGLRGRRVSATLAQELYLETDASVERRRQESEKRELAAAHRPASTGRPDKKQRRKIRQFREKIG